MFLLFQIDSVQSLMQCPRVLVCVGREPSHPSIVDSFRKTPDDKLPKLTLKSQSSGCHDDHEGMKRDFISSMSCILLEFIKCLLSPLQC